MKEFDFDKNYKAILTPKVVRLLSKIHEQKQQMLLSANLKPDDLNQLVEIAKVQSIESSNRIEGIITTQDRIKKLALEKTNPKNRSENEIAGYRDVLNTIHESFEFIPLKTSIILQLHRDLYRYEAVEVGGKYKHGDNQIIETDENGLKKIRFLPLSAWETPDAMEKLCEGFNQALKSTEYDPLLLIPIFILDFLCIHPFNDGNGRMSRLLTLLLLYQSGYSIGKYVSLEKLIEKTKDSYYEDLQHSSNYWIDNQNDYVPFVEYFLNIVSVAYKDFNDRVEIVKGSSKPERIKQIIKESLGKVTKADLVKRCPDIGLVTIQRTLNDLQKNGTIKKIGGGRYTYYIWNWEKDNK
ncbi:Fic family protein [Succinatimonas hippei]|uniref:Fic family protein n=1 Tax=Succinatimonas hippei TaxID=626938 RepID=UPI0023F86A4A|nr:Fic family protein [Succinatimonas hippei]